MQLETKNKKEDNPDSGYHNRSCTVCATIKNFDKYYPVSPLLGYADDAS